MLRERNKEMQRDMFVCLIDYENAHDRGKYEELIRILEQIRVNGKDLIIIYNLYWN